MSSLRFHYTNLRGFNAIRATKDWRFLSLQPPGDHPKGAYFTDYDEQTPLLAQKLRISREKIEYVFGFQDKDDLKPLLGGRGQHIFYSEADYIVEEPRQNRHGKR